VEAEWPRYAVAPDDSAAIRIQYHPAGAGVFGRKIQVFGNFENSPAELVISGNIVDK